jgi:hypothetical protein
MAIRFLCDTHRQMFHEHPAKAIVAWQDSFDRGKSLYDKKQWQASLSFLGSAYETACIIMTTSAIESANAYELLTSPAVLLANSFVMLGYEGESRKVYTLAINRLEQEGHRSAERLCVNQYLGLLYRNMLRLECSAEKTGVVASDTIDLMSATMH